MDEVLYRERYGDNFITNLPDGTVVPWRTLTVEEFITYDKLLKNNQYPVGVIEDEIFSKCVLNQVLVQERKRLTAGTVTTVAQAILSVSGPSSIEELNYVLEISRRVNEDIFHQIVVSICDGFPSYKPEDVYKMNFTTMMLRLAQAESKLLKAGIIAEPYSFYDQENPNTPITPPPLPTQPKPQNLKQRFEQSNKPTKNTIISSQEIQSHQNHYIGHEKTDQVLMEHKMLEETTELPHIKEYLEQMKKDGKLTIKTHEERHAEALARSEQNRLRIEKIQKSKNEAEQKKLEEFAQELKSKAVGKKKKRKRGLRRS